MTSPAPMELRDFESADPWAEALLDPGDLTTESPAGRHEFSLPPVDRGKDAWLFWRLPSLWKLLPGVHASVAPPVPSLLEDSSLIVVPYV